jgi:hypothetical protein
MLDFDIKDQPELNMIACLPPEKRQEVIDILKQENNGSGCDPHWCALGHCASHNDS